MKKLEFILFFLAHYVCFSQCKPEGSAKDAEEKVLNVEKNKSVEIPDAKPKVMRLNSFITKKSKPDRNKFTEGIYVCVSGYVVDYKEQGKETSNCEQADARKKTGDVHIYFGLKPDATKKNCMIVEITPEYKKLHPDYTTELKNAKGNKVKFYGYLIYDYLHEGESLSMCTSCSHAWRKTCWEIHPIVKMEIL